MQLPNTKPYLVATGLLTSTYAFPLAIDKTLEGISYGRYAVFGCGSNNHAIVKLIHTLQTILPLAITDTSMPNPGPAYTAFFKDKANAPFVHDILYNITYGIDVPLLENSTSTIKQGAPAIICATKPGQVMWRDVDGVNQDGYTDCLQAGAAGHALLGIRIVILCPDFFSFPVQPPRSKSQCLTVDPQHTNQFEGEGFSFSRYQLWVLLHELAHVYIFVANGGLSDFYWVNECLNLPANESMMNAQSFNYYVANLFLGCIDFPQVGANTPSGQASRVELLETDDNGTVAAANMTSARNWTVSDVEVFGAYNGTESP